MQRGVDLLLQAPRPPRPPALAARAVGNVVVYRWPEDDLTSFLASHPEVHDGLRFLADSRQLAARMSFPWLTDGETIYGLARKHPALLVRALLLPMLSLSAGLGVLAAGGLSGSGLMTGLGGGLCALGIGLGIWRALAWANG